MSFLEWWGESVDPGKRGTIKVHGDHEPCREPRLVMFRVILVAILLPVVWTVAVHWVPLPTWQSWALVIGVTLIYIAVAYLFRPEPDLDNMGWLGGLMNNPFRWSDDWNRTLLGWKILLGPGRFIAESMADFLVMGDTQTRARDDRPEVQDDPPVVGHS